MVGKIRECIDFFCHRHVGLRINMKNLKILIIMLLMFAGLTLIACGGARRTSGLGYERITPEEAKKLMDTEENYVILDVRTQEEFDEGHIPGAILIPDFEIREKAGQLLPDKNQLILVYCRTGRRSQNAAAELAALGYTNVKEFGGITIWPYETEK